MINVNSAGVFGFVYVPASAPAETIKEALKICSEWALSASVPVGYVQPRITTRQQRRVMCHSG